MTDEQDRETGRPGFDELVDQVRDFAQLRAQPRLGAHEVRHRGLRRRRVRRGATAAGSGALAVAGVFLVVLVFAGHGGPAVVSPAGKGPAAATSPAAPPATAAGRGGRRSAAATSSARPEATASASVSSSPTEGAAVTDPAGLASAASAPATQANSTTSASPSVGAMVTTTR